jgi:hydrogenase expression/formation protein HypE
VVQPLFFAGGDIGSLSINGTVNDLSMCGAEAQYLTASFIIEEGFSLEKLWQIALSMKLAADESEVQIITGDTKVVETGKADGVFINTAGIGCITHQQIIKPSQIADKDIVILSGDIGRHGMAIMSQRENLGFESTIISDCASLKSPVLDLLKHNIEIHCMRDLTRGGLASGLVEIAEKANKEIFIEDQKILVDPTVKSACDILGFDPYHVACEGRFVIILPPSQSGQALKVLRNHEVTKNAAIIGEVRRNNKGRVVSRNAYGSVRSIDMLSGEQLPRIC